jgi:hypothetical protein
MDEIPMMGAIIIYFMMGKMGLMKKLMFVGKGGATKARQGKKDPVYGYADLGNGSNDIKGKMWWLWFT